MTSISAAEYETAKLRVQTLGLSSSTDNTNSLNVMFQELSKLVLISGLKPARETILLETIAEISKAATKALGVEQEKAAEKYDQQEQIYQHEIQQLHQTLQHEKASFHQIISQHQQDLEELTQEIEKEKKEISQRYQQQWTTEMNQMKAEAARRYRELELQYERLADQSRRQTQAKVDCNEEYVPEEDLREMEHILQHTHLQYKQVLIKKQDQYQQLYQAKVELEQALEYVERENRRLQYERDTREQSLRKMRIECTEQKAAAQHFESLYKHLLNAYEEQQTENREYVDKVDSQLESLQNQHRQYVQDLEKDHADEVLDIRNRIERALNKKNELIRVLRSKVSCTDQVLDMLEYSAQSPNTEIRESIG